MSDGNLQRATNRTARSAASSGIICSLCGQAPSVYPDYAETLVRWGIDSISFNPDVSEQTRRHIASAEQKILLESVRAGKMPVREVPPHPVHRPPHLHAEEQIFGIES